jgi:F420 biosynthesis protein FbiB-like protein
MDDFLRLARGRRSIRRYEPRDVPQSTVETLLEAAVWAPSAHNRQPWRFAIVRGAGRERLARAMGARLREDLERDNAPQAVIEADVTRSYERLTGAPVVIVLCLLMADMDTYPDARRQQHEWTMAVQSVAMAGQNLLLAAHAYGLGACWMCAPLFCPDVVQSALDLPPDWQPQGLITLGYAAQTRDKARQPLVEKVVWR